MSLFISRILKIIAKMNYIAFTITVIVTLTHAIDTNHWGYPDLDEAEEFPSWGGVCDSGTRQSPINLSAKGALKGDFDELHFENYDEDMEGITIVNNAHTIQLAGFADEIELKGGPLKNVYVVEQVHLHWWSEHTIDNIRYPLEAHIVHRNMRYPNMTVAVNHSDGITVIAILYHVSNHQNPAIANVLDNLNAIKSFKQINKPIHMKHKFALDDLFPDVKGYMTYAGSLTTPSCAESVTWIVLTETFPVTLEQVDRFKEIEFDQGKQLKNNYRLIQKTNNRAVVVVLDNDDDDDDDDDNHNNSHDFASSLQLSSLSAVLALAILTKELL